MKRRDEQEKDAEEESEEVEEEEDEHEEEEEQGEEDEEEEEEEQGEEDEEAYREEGEDKEDRLSPECLTSPELKPSCNGTEDLTPYYQYPPKPLSLAIILGKAGFKKSRHDYKSRLKLKKSLRNEFSVSMVTRSEALQYHRTRLQQAEGKRTQEKT